MVSFSNYRRKLVATVLGMLVVCQLQVLAEDETVPPPLQMSPVAEVTREIQLAAQRTGGKLLLDQIDAPLQAWGNRVHLGVDNAYAANKIRYLVIRLTLLNRSDEMVTVDSGEITLSGWGETYQVGDRSEEFAAMPVKVDRAVYSMGDLTTPPKMTIPAQMAASFWCVFTGLGWGDPVTGLTVQIPLESGKTLQHVLDQEQAARLGLTVETIGPARSLGLMTIHGALNTVNARNLAARIEEQIQAGCQRFVIRWSSDAAVMDADLVDWLFERAQQQMGNELYAQFPAFSEPKFLALSQLPAKNMDDGIDDRHQGSYFPETADAVLAGLKDLLQVIDPKYVTQEIRYGHPFSQRAALASLGSRVDRATLDNLFPELSQLYDTAKEQTRNYVLLAIGQQDHPEAIPMLINIATREREQDAEWAFVSLLRSRQQAAVSAVTRLMTSGNLNVSPKRQIELLAENYRREWSPYLLDALNSKDEEERGQALRGIVRVGHPESLEILKRALNDSSKNVRDIAFDALVARDDSESEQLAMEYTLSLIEQGVLTESMLTLMSRTRDPRVAPLILEYLKKEKSSRLQLLTLLEQIGDDKIVRELLQMESQLTIAERVQVYNLVVSFDLPEQLEVARAALQSDELQLRQAGIAILTRQASDSAAEAIFALLSTAEQTETTQICYALGRIGTLRAKELLLQFRLQALADQNANGLSAASDGLRLWMSHSAGWSAIESASYHSRVENYENALIYYGLATEIDPELGIAYSGKGNALLKLQKYDEARKAFQQAYELDDFDGQAITGIGIVKAMQGEIKEAVQLTEESSPKFPEDDIFAYNTACVYGRAIEWMKENMNDAASKAIIAGYEAKAIEALESSIEYGFDEFPLMQTDPDLNSLRELPAFQQLLKK